MLAIAFGKPSSYGDFPNKSRGQQFKDSKEATNWFYNGIKSALCVEQYVELRNTIQVLDWSNEDIKRWKYTRVNTTKELLDAINECSNPIRCSVQFRERKLNLFSKLKRTKQYHEV